MTLFAPPIATERLPRVVPLLAALMAWAGQRLARLLTGWRRRHEAAMLVRADEHVLADLGISRADVNDAFSGPPWQDPTVLLRARALERRLSRHRVSHGFPSQPSQQEDFYRPRADRPPRLTP